MKYILLFVALCILECSCEKQYERTPEIYNIDKSELAKYTSLIKQASEGRLESIVMHRADFGTTGFYCYVNGADKENSRIVLSVMSDPLDIINQDASAVKIDNWLKDINMRIINQ
jgi:hypothetical protein